MPTTILLPQAPAGSPLSRATWDLILRIVGQKSRKLRDRFLIGPFRIIEAVNPVTFRLELPRSMRRVHNVFHSDRLEKVHLDATWTDAMSLGAFYLLHLLAWRHEP